MNRFTNKKERMGYYSYFVGQNIVYIFITLFISVYYTTALGIPPAVVATIILVARVWDAINDPMLSILVEKSNFKGGKFKPWITAVAFIIPIMTVIIFSFTDTLATAPLSMKVTFASITYILWGMIYTISDAPAYALATIMTKNLDERNSLISFSRIGALVGIMGAMVVGPILVDKTGGNWFISSLILSTIALLFLIQVKNTKERVMSKQKSPTLRQIIGAIIKNRYVVVTVVTIIFMNGFNFALTITPFLAEHVYGDAKLTSAILGITMMPMLIGAPLLPRFIRMFGKNILMKFSLIVIIIFSILIFFTSKDNFVLFLVLSFIKMTLSSFSMIIGALFFADAIEFDYYTNGTRYEAAIFSAQTFSNKAMGAVSGAGGMYLLALFGFKESVAGEVIIQTQSAINGIWATYNIGPAVGGILALIAFSLFYNMDEKKLRKLGLESGRLTDV